jgi:hypothetical protein
VTVEFPLPSLFFLGFRPGPTPLNHDLITIESRQCRCKNILILLVWLAFKKERGQEEPQKQKDNSVQTSPAGAGES